MSRLGKLPIKITSGTQIKLENGLIMVKGPKGELERVIHPLVKVEITSDELLVSVNNPEVKLERSLWGLTRTLIDNMVTGVNSGFAKKLEVNGVGYRAAVNGQKLVLNLGFSHPIEFELPKGISAQVEGNVITISGINNETVGEVSAQIRKLRKPEPYQGKGIKYVDEVIRRKEGKTATKGA